MKRRVAGLVIGAFVCAAAAAPPFAPSAAAESDAAPGGALPGRARDAATAISPASRVIAPLIALAPEAAAGISGDVLRLATGALDCAVRSGDIAPPRTLTVIDYSRPSTEPRLWVFEVATARLLFHELVAHGRNTGENLATRFSDQLNSRQSSLGLFVTADTYVGSNGYSLRMDGLEPGFNAHARERAIVMHGAPYVDAALAKQQGRIGRSWGCPALRDAVARDVIDTVRGGGVIFSYYPDEKWLTTSRFLNCPAASVAAL